MIKLASAAVVLLGSVALAAAATPQCLAPNEIEAEQAVRFQAELMVVSDTCGAQTYTQFARRNRTVLVDYQKQVIDRFRRDGTAKAAEAKFDSYLTRLANEVSLRTGAQPVAAMCRDAAPFLANAESLGADGFRRYVAEQAAAHRSDYRSCAN